jgi:hypothetical protein
MLRTLFLHASDFATLQRRRDSMSPERADKIPRPTNGESELELRARDRTCDLRFTKALLYR